MNKKFKKLRKGKNAYIGILALIVLILGVVLVKSYLVNNTDIKPTSSLSNKAVTIPLNASYLLLAKENPSNGNISVYKLEKDSGRTISQNDFSLTAETGGLGCSSFKGSYSVCKNAIWFSSDGQKAIVQTEYQQAMFEEPPFWYAWYLLDIKSGKLTQLYKADIRLVEWAYDETNNKVYFKTEVENNKNEPLPKKYFQLDVASKSLL